MRTHWIAFLPALIAACSSHDASKPGGASGNCVARSGSYRVNYTERSGDCGPVPEQVIVLDTQAGGALSRCTGQATADAHNCAITEDVTCPGNSPGYMVTSRGVINWSEDATMGAGIVQETVSVSGSVQCASSYDIAYTKL